MRKVISEVLSRLNAALKFLLVGPFIDLIGAVAVVFVGCEGIRRLEGQLFNAAAYAAAVGWPLIGWVLWTT